jgi:hypothetical protein
MAKATRPIFIPEPSSPRLVKEINLQFEWSMGMARAQKQKSLAAFHAEAKGKGYPKVLEISTYSSQPLGVQLSAFNLFFNSKNSSGTIEELYQKSKVLNKNADLIYEGDKKTKGEKPVSFLFENHIWPLNPQTCFYDWLYINALYQNPELGKRLFEFDAFTDIAYNPKKSLSTQARSAALYIALTKLNKIEEIKKPDNFMTLLNRYDYMREPKNLFNA